MKRELLSALSVTFITLFATGVVYPLLVTQVAGIFFPRRAAGSLISDGQGRVIGSALLRQEFKNPAYFFPRPAGSSQLAQTSKALVKRIEGRVSELLINGGDPTAGPWDVGGRIPLDLVTTSASGLDPHISVVAAHWQAPQVARHRNVPLKRVITLIEMVKEPPQLYVLGEARLNVLKLNLALDELLGSPGRTP